MANPYLAYFRLLPPSCRRDASLPIVAHGELMSPGWLSFKNAVAGFYSWAVPTQSAIDVIAETTARVVEIGGDTPEVLQFLAGAAVDAREPDVRGRPLPLCQTGRSRTSVSGRQTVRPVAG